jgi:hypothetical protein
MAAMQRKSPKQPLTFEIWHQIQIAASLHACPTFGPADFAVVHFRELVTALTNSSHYR